ncbi:MAG: IspD, partial [Pseudomonadota bacterium]|jgi:2-C-methyl-D-erythritol 4-phosphate cytidylyltransferase
VVLIVAAGVGARAGGALPKQYQKIKGRSVLEHTVRAFSNNARPQPWPIHIVVSAQDAHADSLRISAHFHKVGGSTRAESVYQGCRILHALYPQDPWVLVHDAARCSLPNTALLRLEQYLKAYEHPALLALPVSDSLHRLDNDTQGKSVAVSREHLWAAQTPQAAKLSQLLMAYQQPEAMACTDEYSALQAVGITMSMVQGDRQNIKITYPEDFAFVEKFL